MNHTSSEHEWALQAAKGNPEYSAYYWTFPDRHVPNEFEKTLPRRSVSSLEKGSFVQLADGRWVWSTFESNQWDLN